MHAGAAIQLVARREVLSALVSASIAPRTTQAGTPRKVAPRKMKRPPAVRLAFVPGMRTGCTPETTTRLASTTSCAHCAGPKLRQLQKPHASTSAPAATTAHQYAWAPRL